MDKHINSHEVTGINSRVSIACVWVEASTWVKIATPQTINAWRGGKSKKGGKVGYERR